MKKKINKKLSIIYLLKIICILSFIFLIYSYPKIDNSNYSDMFIIFSIIWTISVLLDYIDLF
jgi:hypothetical protein